MKLEIKHLAPYLPYGLKMYWEDYKNIPQEPWELKCEAVDFVLNNQNKPILRPLSDLTKEIEVNGQKFVPSKEYHYLRFDEISNYKGGSSTLGFIQAREQDILLELHFDIFGLIENNLAININDEK